MICWVEKETFNKIGLEKIKQHTGIFQITKVEWILLGLVPYTKWVDTEVDIYYANIAHDIFYAIVKVDGKYEPAKFFDKQEKTLLLWDGRTLKIDIEATLGII